MTEARYRCIVADPPWPGQRPNDTNPSRGKPERHYQTMSIEAIMAYPVWDMAYPDCHLWLWGINRLLGEAYTVAKAWGFIPLTLITWCKTAPGVGYYVRNNTEHVLLATRGKPMVPEHPAMSSWYFWKRGQHSQKPDDFYYLAEQVSPGPRAELFARASRIGWDTYGDEKDRGTGPMFEPWLPRMDV